MILTYHGDPKLKAQAVEWAEKHAEQDMLLSGTYGKMNGQFRGCSVGCDAFDITGKVMEEGCHKVTSEHFGFPLWLEYLRDYLFENLPKSKRANLHVEIKKAIPVGKDISNVNHNLHIWIQKQNLARVESLPLNLELKNQVIDAINATINLRKKSLIDGWDKSAADSARSAARSAAWSAADSARSAAWSAADSARSAARSAVRSAADSAKSAAWSAADSAKSAARSALNESIYLKLIELLKGE